MRRIDTVNTRRALADLMAERLRQQEAEGWTPEHDDSPHRAGHLSAAASCYAFAAADLLDPRSKGDGVSEEEPPHAWPWADAWWKINRDDPRRALVKAGALIVAEIERLDRNPLPGVKAADAPAVTETERYPAGVSMKDHVAHDMRMGRFPARSPIETFLAERASAANPSPALAKGGDAVREALALARPIVESDLSEAKDAGDADWTFQSQSALAAIDAALSTPTEGPASQTDGMGGDALREALKIAAAALERAAGRFNMMGGVGLVNGADPRAGYSEAYEAAYAARAALTPPETAEAVPVASFGALRALANELSWNPKTRSIADSIRTAIEIDRAAAARSSSSQGANAKAKPEPEWVDNLRGELGAILDVSEDGTAAGQNEEFDRMVEDVLRVVVGYREKGSK